MRPSLVTTIQLGPALLVFAGQPIQNVQVTLRGKKYDISEVTTVKELKERVQKESGEEPSQHSLLFGGKRLKSSDVLSDVGVPEGAQLSMVPASLTKKTDPTKKSAAVAGTPDTKNMMEDYMKQAGIDTSQIDEIMKSMGGMGGSGEAPSMKESLDMMSDMMKSPMFQQFMNDPEQLEKSRQMILSNPMMKGMMSGMPGMDEILNDPMAWKEAMTAAASMYQSMDPEQLMKAMGGANPMGGGSPGAGLFDGTQLENSAAAAALNELDEDD
jgi:hypothetical protein